jgi:hypothetical protein
VAPSPSLPNSGDLTVAESSGAASRWSVPRSDFPPFDLDRTARTTGYRYAHARLTPWPACQRHLQLLILPSQIFLRPILIERLGPPRTAWTPSDPPPSDLDRTTRTIVAIRFPLALGPLG